MDFKYEFLVFLHFTWILHLTGGQDCTFPAELQGEWTSTNLGTINITGTTPSLSITQIFTGQTGSGNDFNCRYVSGTQYVLQAVSSFNPFTGTGGIFMWMCLDLRRASDYSYYYYLNSDQEGGFDNYRLVGLPEGSSIAVSDVCTTTLDVAEFNTMIKTESICIHTAAILELLQRYFRCLLNNSRGDPITRNGQIQCHTFNDNPIPYGEQTAAVAAVQCAEPLLGKFNFTYSDSTVSSTSSNASFITACDEWNRTHISVNNSGLSGVDPFYSTEGLVGCIANVYDSTSGVYFTSLYNLDSSPNPEFICVATQVTEGIVYLSMKQSDCDSGQSPTVLPTDGALMVLTPECIPQTVESQKSQSWIWLCVLLPCIFLLIVFTAVFICLHVRVRRREKDHARTKKAFNHENHPLGEMSLPLDAPPSLDRRSSYIDEDEELLTTRKRTGRGKNILGEQSLNLNLEYNKWSRLENVKQPAVTNKGPPTSNGVLGKRRLHKASVPAPSEISRTQTYKSHTTRSSVIKSSMLEKKISNTKQNGLFKSRTSLKLGTASRSIHSASRPGSSKKNGVHPAPRKPASRPSSSRSRRGSIDNLVIDRNKRALTQRRPLRSNTMVLSSSADESAVKSPSDINPTMFTMPEEYSTEGGPNQLIPERPSLTPNRSLVDTYRSLRTFRNNTGLRLMKPNASRSSWR